MLIFHYLLQVLKVFRFIKYFIRPIFLLKKNLHIHAYAMKEMISYLVLF